MHILRKKSICEVVMAVQARAALEEGAVALVVHQTNAKNTNVAAFNRANDKNAGVAKLGFVSEPK